MLLRDGEGKMKMETHPLVLTIWMMSVTLPREASVERLWQKPLKIKRVVGEKLGTSFVGNPV